MILPDFKFEKSYWKDGFTVIGIDEVGRGAFAGPVGVGGVVFESNLSSKKQEYLLSLGINDSKKLSAKKRLALSKIIKENCLAYEIAFINVEIINDIGIGKATFQGMRQVAESINYKLSIHNSFLLIDAFEIPGMGKQKGIIRGDSLSISIAAASIIAKVERDHQMEELGHQFPNYKWDENKGYGTSYHRAALEAYGSNSHHRTQFISAYVA